MSVDVAAIRADVQRDWFLCPLCAWSGHAPKEWASGVKVCPRCLNHPVRIPWNKAGHAETALALCDEVDALRAALAAKDAENERLRGALEQIAFPPLRVTGFGDIDTVDEYDPAGVAVAALDARAALADGEATG